MDILMAWITWFGSDPAAVDDVSEHLALRGEGVFHHHLLRAHHVLHLGHGVQQQRVPAPDVTRVLGVAGISSAGALRHPAGAIVFAGAYAARSRAFEL